MKNPVCLGHTGFFILFGGAKRDRTADLNTASVALSQLSYSPKTCDSRVVSGAHSRQLLPECQAKNLPGIPKFLPLNQVVNS